ncbi:ArsA family ATPase [Eisenibacter elegans]|jgi:arsenite-transporting ATPase|uniref:ArsA family ATPase n=1 Tax=Eisenibacter elegans TaxID=997 RepID=UPI0004010E69|nr:ArsA family ATPase [Eisenibacter elegans]
MRILLFTGKGGVGKTTLAAATALRCAALGYKTLIISTDPAHSLSDSLNIALGPEPTPVLPKLFGQELDVYYSMKKHWEQLRQMLLVLFRSQGLQHTLAEELSALPGMEEASAFLWIEQYHSLEVFDVIVIDSAPTGETLTLLSLPQVSKWWTTQMFPFQKAAIKAVGGVVRGVTGIPLDKGYEELDSLFAKLEIVQQIFARPEVTSMRLVMNPERMVIQEAKRAYTYLQLHGYAVDAAFVNRILPPDAAYGAFFDQYLEQQEGYLKQIAEDFAPLPLFKSYHQGQEVFGLDTLTQMADMLYQGQDPTKVFHQEQPMHIAPEGKGYLLRLKIPFLDPQTPISLQAKGNELTIHLGSRRRHLFLPQFLAYYQLQNHRLSPEGLLVYFEPRAEEA